MGPWNFGSWSAIQVPPLPPAVIYGAIFDPPPQIPTPPPTPPLGLATGADELAHAVAHRKVGRVGGRQPVERPPILWALGTLGAGRPFRHPPPPRSSMGRFSTPPSIPTPPPPLGLATGADELAHAVALGLAPRRASAWGGWLCQSTPNFAVVHNVYRDTLSEGFSYSVISSAARSRT